MSKTPNEEKPKKEQRVQRMEIHPSHPNFKSLEAYTHSCKNLYNYALYRVRASFIYWPKVKSGEPFPNYENITPVLEDLAEMVDAYNAKRSSEWVGKCLTALKKGKKIPNIPYFTPLGVNHLYPNYKFMDFYCQESTEYKALLASTSQQVLRKLDKNWVSFFASIKDWNDDPSKYSGKPGLPKYLPKDGYFEAIFSKVPKLSERELSIPVKNDKNGRKLPNKTVTQKGFYLSEVVGSNIFVPYDKPNKVAQIRIVPKLNHFVIEVVYNVEETEEKEDNGVYISGDLGLDNFVTLVNNVGLPPLILDGKPAKSVNQFYNKRVSEDRSKIMEDKAGEFKNKNPDKKYKTPAGCTSSLIKSITANHNAFMDDFIHKASKATVDYALECGANTIILGKNKGWKDSINLGTQTNQNFVCIPHARFIEKVQYKAAEKGIRVIVTEESYTSKTSALDHESPTKTVSDQHKKKAYDRCLPMDRRKHRGLYTSNGNESINADVNGAFQIMRKVHPEALNGIPQSARVPAKLNVQRYNLASFRVKQQKVA